MPVIFITAVWHVKCTANTPIVLNLSASMSVGSISPAVLAMTASTLPKNCAGESRGTRLTVSIGVSWNKIYAKLGSDLRKPDAVTAITRDNYIDVVYPLPVEDLIYVGRATAHKLRRIGVRTIGQLAALGPTYLRSVFGVVGLNLHAFATGLDETPVAETERENTVKSVGNSLTTHHDLYTEQEIKAVTYMLSESVTSRLRDAGMAARTIQISMRDYQLQLDDGALPFPTQLCSEIAAAELILNISTRSED